MWAFSSIQSLPHPWAQVSPKGNRIRSQGGAGSVLHRKVADELASVDRGLLDEAAACDARLPWRESWINHAAPLSAAGVEEVLHHV